MIENDKRLPFQLILLVGPKKQEVPILNLTNNPQYILNNLYQIEEFVDIEIKVKMNRNYPIAINWGSVSDKEDDISISFVLEQDQQVYSLYLNEKDKGGYPWRCGIYHFEVTYNDKNYYGGFKVAPRNINERQLDKIHEYINIHLEGLAIDNINFKNTFADLSTFEKSSHWQFINWYKDIEKRLHQSLFMIENNSQKIMRKMYLIENQPKHIDSRSIRWENSSKGQVLKGNSYLNRKLILDFDSSSNRLVKFRLRLLVTHIERIINMISEVNDETESKLNEVTKDIESLIKQVDQMQLNVRVSEREKIRMKKALKSKEFDQEKIRLNSDNIKSVQKKMILSKKLIYNRLRSEFWSNIGDRPPKELKLENSPGYHVFQQVWNQYAELTVAKSTKTFRLPVYRPTYELYEYFVFLSVMSIMIELGFDAFTDPIREQLISTFFESGLIDGTTVSYQKENKRVDIIYEGLVEPNDNVAIKKETHFFSSRNHRKPDIRMVMYVIGEGQMSYHSSFIIEVKYRPLINIYSQIGNTEAMDQMNDYWNITYVYNENGEIKYNRNSIKHVVCVYPGDKYAEIQEKSAPGEFLQYYPSQNEDIIVGKEELKILINTWLESE